MFDFKINIFDRLAWVLPGSCTCIQESNVAHRVFRLLQGYLYAFLVISIQQYLISVNLLSTEDSNKVVFILIRQLTLAYDKLSGRIALPVMIVKNFLSFTVAHVLYFVLLTRSLYL